ncbi:MAG: bifunctional demethylmenaquinone methyltransferase/2-methoxy-6-polyprenyl-1,4-benzoquinol methylase UbiE [Kiritimatiellae bacterium]|nr:bifunctional demethylmenaquinone methyltransferase/2-methoxy-6-polyprenyl-1,4-benzoquinol methylase UbiE [Kiritimatiellia bacterium]
MKSQCVESVTPYQTGERKTEQIRKAFNTIAPRYDRLNRILSLGIDLSWRKKALHWLASSPPQHLLDVATGTGDLALLAGDLFPDAEITGLDLSPEMLKIAERKAAEKGQGTRYRFLVEDVLETQLPPASFDAVTVAFGVRNFENVLVGLTAMCQLLRPGGRLILLELSRPRNPVIRFFYRFYLRGWMPFVGRLVSGHAAEYRYLPASIDAVPQGEAMLALLRQAGFTNSTYRCYTFGVCTAYFATVGKAADAAS